MIKIIKGVKSMNTKNIKRRANELLIESKSSLTRILIIISAINLIPVVFSGSDGILGTLSFIVTILFLTVEHGYIVSSLKIVRNNASALKDEDAWVGFTRFSELFSTYVLMYIIRVGIMIMMILILLLLMLGVYGSSVAVLGGLVGGNTTDFLLSGVSLSPALIFFMFLIVLIAVVIAYVIDIYLFCVPYLLEQHQMKNVQAIKESIRLMKKHGWDFFKLDISFIGWILLQIFVISMLSGLLQVIPIFGTVIAAFLGMLVGIYTYLPQYIVSKAIFFEEIAYQNYHFTQPQDIFENDNQLIQSQNIVENDNQGE